MNSNQGYLWPSTNIGKVDKVGTAMFRLSVQRLSTFVAIQMLRTAFFLEN